MPRPAPTFAPDSALVTLVRPGLAVSRGILLPRMGQAVAVVTHTTGGGINARFKREGARKGDASPFETAMRVYATIMEASPHYVVGQCGSVGQVVPEELCAWHVGGAGSAPYHRAAWVPWRANKRFAWWLEKWAGLAGPRDLAGGQLWAPYVIGPSLAQRLRHPLSWGKGSVNAWSYSLEVVPPIDDPGGPWSPECWRSVAALHLDIGQRQGVPLERDCRITHSDAHPLSRTTPSGKAWDTVDAQWSWERFELEAAQLGRAA